MVSGFADARWHVCVCVCGMWAHRHVRQFGDLERRVLRPPRQPFLLLEHTGAKERGLRCCSKREVDACVHAYVCVCADVCVCLFGGQVGFVVYAPVELRASAR
jgi:hypothetical protein